MSQNEHSGPAGSPRWAAMVLALSSACLPPPSVDSASTADTGADDEPVAEFGLTDVATELPTAIEQMFSSTATPVLDAYEAIMATEDSTCPYYRQTEGGDIWYQIPSCTSEQGTSFYGSAYTDSNGHTTGDYSATRMFMLCYVELADGSSFTGNGTVEQTTAIVEDSVVQGTLSIQGGFHWDGPGSEGTWISEDAIPTVDVTTLYSPVTGIRSLELDGFLEGELDGFDAASFQGVVLAEDSAGNCTTEPEGLFSLRDETGNWYTLTLDGTGDPSTPACDGCGELTWRGQDLGSICLDLTQLLAWEEAPW